MFLCKGNIFPSTFEGLNLNMSLFETNAFLGKSRSTKIYTYSQKKNIYI